METDINVKIEDIGLNIDVTIEGSGPPGPQGKPGKGLPDITSSDDGKVAVIRKGEWTVQQIDHHFVPIEAAIRPTVSGESINIQDSVEFPILALKIFGKTTQSAVPSIENPIPMVSVGESGSITLTITDSKENSQSVTIPIPGGLHGIPVENGGNYIDSNGQQWICDSIEKNSIGEWEIIRRCKIGVIDGNINNIHNGRQQDQNFYGCECGDFKSDLINAQVNLLSNKLKFLRINTTLHGEEFTYVSSNGVIVFGIKKSLISEDTKQAVNSYLSQNPITIIYPLKSPALIPLNDTNLINALNYIHSYSNKTNIQCTDNSGVFIQYLANIQKYIDRKSLII